MPSPDPKYPNSAGRLLSVLQTLQLKIPIALQLSRIFLDEPGLTNDPKVLAKIGVRVLAQLQMMYSEFLEDMNEVDIGDEQRTVLLSGLLSMEDCIFPLQLHAATRLLNGAERSLLEVCATVLPKEGVLTKPDLDSIKNSIDSLQEQINDANTSPTLKKILLELIRLSQDSINRFNIHGARGLRKAFKGMIAEVVELHATTSKKDIEEIKKSKAWNKITTHLEIIDSVTGKLLKYRPLLEKAIKLFLE